MCFICILEMMFVDNVASLYPVLVQSVFLLGSKVPNLEYLLASEPNKTKQS